MEPFNNPIIPGFYPDPSICRVNEDYYLVTSTFEYFPGVPIFHSTDLVNWRQIGHVLDRPEQLNLDGTPNSRGIYAPTIRYNNGLFYMITTFVESQHGARRNFFVTAKDPAGPWSDPVWIKGRLGLTHPCFLMMMAASITQAIVSPYRANARQAYGNLAPGNRSHYRLPAWRTDWDLGWCAKNSPCPGSTPSL